MLGERSDQRGLWEGDRLYLEATVANLTPVVAKAGLPVNTGGGSSAGSALRAGTIRSALEIVPARLAQILTLALLASASLPEYISPNRAFRPHLQIPETPGPARAQRNTSPSRRSGHRK